MSAGGEDLLLKVGKAYTHTKNMEMIIECITVERKCACSTQRDTDITKAYLIRFHLQFSPVEYGRVLSERDVKDTECFITPVIRSEWWPRRATHDNHAVLLSVC